MKRKVLVRCAILASIAVAASAIAAAPAQAAGSTTANETEVKCRLQGLSHNAYQFTGKGVKIWSEPGRGIVKGHGQTGQAFCFDTTQGSWIHGTNRQTLITGWVHKSLLKPYGT